MNQFNRINSQNSWGHVGREILPLTCLRCYWTVWFVEWLSSKVCMVQALPWMYCFCLHECWLLIVKCPFNLTFVFLWLFGNLGTWTKIWKFSLFNAFLRSIKQHEQYTHMKKCIFIHVIFCLKFGIFDPFYKHVVNFLSCWSCYQHTKNWHF